MAISNAAELTQRRALAFTCCLAMFLYAIYLAAIGVMLAAIGNSFHLGTDAQGRLFPANFAGYITMVLITGQVSDRLNRKGVLMAGLCVFAVGLVLFSRAPSFDVALWAALLIGGGSGAAGVAMSALAADLYAHRRAAMLAAIQVAFGLGACLGPGLAYVLLHNGISWRALYAGLAFANFGLLVILQAQSEPSHPRKAKQKGSAPIPPSLLRLMTQRPVQIFCLCNFLYSGAEVGFFAWMPSYFERRLPGGAPFAGAVVTIFWIAMTVGRSLVGKWIGRLPLLRVTVCLALVGAACAALALVWHLPLVVMTFVVCTGLCFAGIYVLLIAEASERYPAGMGALFGCIVASGGLGSALLPWAIGVLAATSVGWHGALALVPMAALGVAACTLLLQYPFRHDPRRNNFQK